MLPQRPLFFIVFLFCSALIAAALYFQHGLGMDPCPLCILQRIAVMAVGIIALLAALHHPHGLFLRLYGLFSTLAATAGAAIAGRHVWLQHLPEDELPACGPGLDYIMDTFPLLEAADIIMRGSGECANVSWTFLGLTMPGWMLLIFICMALASLAIVLIPRKMLRD